MISNLAEITNVIFYLESLHFNTKCFLSETFYEYIFSEPLSNMKFLIKQIKNCLKLLKDNVRNVNYKIEKEYVNAEPTCLIF